MGEKLKQLEEQLEAIESRLIELTLKLEKLQKIRSAILNDICEEKILAKEKEFINYLDEKGLVLYKYTLSTDYAGCDTTEYVLIPKEINDAAYVYGEDLDELALENLHSFGYLTEEEYYDMADELDIDLEDEEAVEESDLVYYDYSYCYWDIEKVEDLNEVIGYIDLDMIEEWR